MGYYKKKCISHTTYGSGKIKEIFDLLRDMEYTVSEAKLISKLAYEIMEKEGLSMQDAIRKALS